MLGKHNIVKTKHMKYILNVAVTSFILFSMFCDKNQQAELMVEKNTSALTVPSPSIDWFISNPDADTFNISTADELAGLATIVNNMANIGQPFNFSGRTIVLIEDVNLSAYGESYRYNIDTDTGNMKVTGWVPIGKFDVAAFSGTFDGDRKTIRGLYIGGVVHNTGLFGWVNGGGVVKNLVIEDVNINAGFFVGAVVGLLDDSKVVNNSVSGAVRGKSLVGGVVGGAMNGATISNCHFTGTVYSEDDGGVGGVAGIARINSRIINSYSFGTVIGKDFVGGVAGGIEYNSSMINSFSVSTVYGKTSVGGVVGYLYYSSKLSNSYSIGDVGGELSVGGVVGAIINKSSVVNSYSTGAVSGAESVGGIVGYIDSVSASVIDCAALNLSVRATGLFFGRVVGSIHDNVEQVELSNNIAFNNMINIADNAFWFGKSMDTQNGADITVAEINSDPTLGNRFTSKNGWIVRNNSLPGFDKPVDMPLHLRVVTEN